VIDHELRGQKWVHPPGVAAHRRHGVAHRRQVHDRGHAREVLHQDARGHERDLVVRGLPRIPAGEGLDLFGAHGAPILAAQQILEQDAQRVGQTGNRKAALLERREAEDLPAPPARGELPLAAEAVRRRHSTLRTPTTKYWVSPKQRVGTPMCWWYTSATRLPIVSFTWAATESSRTVK